MTQQEPSQRKTSSRPIGVFDSGLGGLRVLDRLKETLPNERFVYLGDTMHMPYGLKTPAEIETYLAACLDWLVKTHDVKMIVVACNTASAVASHLFAGYPDIPFVDPVTPICDWLHHTATFKRVGLMATLATVNANRYQQLLDAMGSPILLKQIPCIGLASVIEAGEMNSPACEAMLKEFIAPLLDWQMDALVLGCTHYPYAIPQVARLLPETVEILDPSVFMAQRAAQLLHDKYIAAPDDQAGHVDYHVTRQPEQFYRTSGAMPFQHIVMQPPKLVAIDFNAEPGLRAETI